MGIYHQISRSLFRRLYHCNDSRTISIRHVAKNGVSSITRELNQAFQISATRNNFIFRVSSQYTTKQASYQRLMELHILQIVSSTSSLQSSITNFPRLGNVTSTRTRLTSRVLIIRNHTNRHHANRRSQIRTNHQNRRANTTRDSVSTTRNHLLSFKQVLRHSNPTKRLINETRPVTLNRIVSLSSHAIRIRVRL